MKLKIEIKTYEIELLSSQVDIYRQRLESPLDLEEKKDKN